MSEETTLLPSPEAPDEIDTRLVQIVPSKRQLKFQQMEFYAFSHFL